MDPLTILCAHTAVHQKGLLDDCMERYNQMRNSNTSTASQAFSHVLASNEKRFPHRRRSNANMCERTEPSSSFFTHSEHTSECIFVGFRINYALCACGDLVVPHFMERPEKPEESDGRALRLQTRMDRWCHHCPAYTRSERARVVLSLA